MAPVFRRIQIPHADSAAELHNARETGHLDGVQPARSADGSGLGLRLVVPWGRPRAPLLPALGKPSPCYWRRQALLTPTGRASRKRPLQRRIARRHRRPESARPRARTPPAGWDCAW